MFGSTDMRMVVILKGAVSLLAWPLIRPHLFLG